MIDQIMGTLYSDKPTSEWLTMALATGVSCDFLLHLVVSPTFSCYGGPYKLYICVYIYDYVYIYIYPNLINHVGQTLD